MEGNSYTEKMFTIDVNSSLYYVEPVCNDGNCTRFKISTECEYMFTLYVDKHGNWQMESDVKPIDEGLIDEIGKAIEHS
ncbi:MAG TPA: hypothetical protein VFW07_11990 [Parafilimonas sp.]|nr:hypothetical protein [Parafilimonas sp.]